MNEKEYLEAIRTQREIEEKRARIKTVVGER